jgi:hypothetical protein
MLKGEACVENLWSMKVILRWFELVSGSKVNFSKSSVIGINVSNNYLDVVASFLHCKIETLFYLFGFASGC